MYILQLYLNALVWGTSNLWKRYRKQTASKFEVMDQTDHTKLGSINSTLTNKLVHDHDEPGNSFNFCLNGSQTKWNVSAIWQLKLLKCVTEPATCLNIQPTNVKTRFSVSPHQILQQILSSKCLIHNEEIFYVRRLNIKTCCWLSHTFQ